MFHSSLPPLAIMRKPILSKLGGGVTENEKPRVHDIAYVYISDIHIEEDSILTNIIGGNVTENEKPEVHDVAYVCISDMHLGEEDSLLTNIEGGNLDTGKASEVMVKLVKCLKEIIDINKNQKEKPTLILNGDILEMALAQTNVAAMTFDRFLELIIDAKDPLFDRVIYIPGNHDHHIWELAREMQYISYIRRNPKDDLPFPWHKTPLCLPPLYSDKRIYSEFLNSLIERRSNSKYKGIKLDEGIKIEVAYPNLGLFSEDGRKCVLFHHGHFVEATYRLMSYLKANALGIDRDIPLDVQMLESENFAWIDFFWSTMGRSGDAGEISETFYEHLSNKESIEKLTAEIAHNLSKKSNIIPFLPDRINAEVIKFLLGRHIFGRLLSDWERCYDGNPAVENTVRGMVLYLQTAWNQIIEEREGDKPSELTFIFGHTHKPFDLCIPLTGILIDGLNTDVNIYNTGGWVVDEALCNEKKGASIILLDKELNCLALYMYNETKCPITSCVKLKCRKTDDNPFYEKIKSRMENNKEPWDEFSNILDCEVKLRKEEIKCRLQGL